MEEHNEKIILLIMVAILLIMMAPAAMAQPKAGEKALLIRMDSSSSEIGGIFHVTDRLSINPSFSFTAQTQDVSNSSGGIGDQEIEMTRYSFETGFYYTLNVSEQMSCFLGPSIGYQKEVQKWSISKDQRNEELEGLLVAGVFGVQYMFTDQFGIMGTIELRNIILTSSDTFDDEKLKMTGEQIGTDQSLRVVFYF